MIDVNNPPVAIRYGAAPLSHALGEAIVDYIDGEMVRMIAWRARSTNWLTSADAGPGSVKLEACYPHPYPDKLLAEFTAWQLTR